MQLEYGTDDSLGNREIQPKRPGITPRTIPRCLPSGLVVMLTDIKEKEQIWWNLLREIPLLFKSLCQICRGLRNLQKSMRNSQRNFNWGGKQNKMHEILFLQLSPMNNIPVISLQIRKRDNPFVADILVVKLPKLKKMKKDVNNANLL